MVTTENLCSSLSFSSLVLGPSFTFVAVVNHSLNVDMTEMVPDIPFDPSLQYGTCSLSDSACNYLSFDFAVVAMASWALFQSLWVLFVVASQLTQIYIAYTTNEAVNYHRFDYLSHPDDLLSQGYRKRYVNPFDFGPIRNCTDFWTRKANLLDGLTWFTVYEVPTTLSHRATRRGGYRSV